jgi:hypothetical protein
VGSYFQPIIDVEATAEEADALADRLLAWLVERGEVEPGWVTRNETSIDGVVVDTRRTVFYSRTDDLYIHLHPLSALHRTDHRGGLPG